MNIIINKCKQIINCSKIQVLPKKYSNTVRYFDNTAENDTPPLKKKTNNKKKFHKNNNEVKDVKIYKANLKSRRLIGKNLNLIKKKPNPNPKYPGKAPIDKKLLEKHSRGEGVNEKNVRLNINKLKQHKKEQAIQFSTEQSARAEILLTEQAGLLEADAGETTTQFRQREIVNNVDITAATKHFDLQLNEFGPYRMRYTRNGRHLLLGGRGGHIAALDWVTKRLHTEINVMESVHDVCWLHLETMFAVAQKEWLHIYDNQGIELHCMKKINKVTRMEFLPYHFLLATASEEGYLNWLDISIGKIISQYNSKLGRLSIMCQNPWNAVLCVGNTKGVVSMWSPNMREPLAKMLCHNANMTALDVDPRGLYLATAATDRLIKLWDVRKLEGPLQTYKVRATANDLRFSQKGLLGVAMGNIVEVYKDCVLKSTKRSYLRHVLNTPIQNMQFCPYEDVLGVASAKGFCSLLVPGAGEPNFDALEVNPYQNKKQRMEREVKMLLDKVQPEFISLDPTVIADLDVVTLQEKLEAKKKLLYVKPPKINMESRKVKRNLSSVKLAKNKKIIQEDTKRKFIKDLKQVQAKESSGDKSNEVTKQKPTSVLDRFLPKK